MCIYLVEVWAWLWATLLLTCLTLLQLVTWVTKLYLVAVPFYRYLLLAVPPISFCHHYFFLAVFWVLSSSFSSLLASQKLCSLIRELSPSCQWGTTFFRRVAPALSAVGGAPHIRIHDNRCRVQHSHTGGQLSLGRNWDLKSSVCTTYETVNSKVCESDCFLFDLAANITY